MSAPALVFIRDLSVPFAAPRWPNGSVRLPFSAETAPAAHALLKQAYADGFGEVGTYADWYDALVADAEYDPDLCFLYSSSGVAFGFAQVWTSGFVKDIAVAESHRRRGIGKALLLTVYAKLRDRGLGEVRLKVVPGNANAIALYRTCGMREG